MNYRVHCHCHSQPAMHRENAYHTHASKRHRLEEGRAAEVGGDGPMTGKATGGGGQEGPGGPTCADPAQRPQKAIPKPGRSRPCTEAVGPPPHDPGGTRRAAASPSPITRGQNDGDWRAIAEGPGDAWQGTPSRKAREGGGPGPRGHTGSRNSASGEDLVSQKNWMYRGSAVSCSGRR